VRIALGRRVREIRAERGWTVRVLANLTGVTSGFISQIENGQVTPSVANLVNLAKALEVQVGELFDALPNPNHHVLRRRERRSYTLNPGLVDEILSNDPTKQLEVLIRYQEPGASSGEPYTHDSHVEFALVLRGTIEMILGGETVRLRAGDAITCGGEIPGTTVNVGKLTAQVLWAVTPATY
jgi:transcriptional regulator with XRE-family HTH domain